MDHTRNCYPRARPPGPTVCLLLSQRKYEQAVVASHERPQDLQYEYGHGESPLHLLCRADNPRIDVGFVEAVEAIVAALPSLVDKPNQKGWTPLHHATAVKRLDESDLRVWEKQVVVRLIHACPKAILHQLPKHDHCKTPFHLACANGMSADTLRIMLDYFSSLATQPFLMSSNTVTYGYPLCIVWSAPKPVQDKMPTMELLLRAATGASLNQSDLQDGDEGNKNISKQQQFFDVLRAACQTNPCPQDYLKILCQRYPQRASWTDDRGYLPLHHVLMNAIPKFSSHTEFLIRKLCHIYPTAAAVPFTTKENSVPILPLHYLLTDSNVNYYYHAKIGVDDLIKAYPEAIEIPDPRTGLVPALITAESAIQSRNHLTTTYKLLLQSPEVFEGVVKD